MAFRRRMKNSKACVAALVTCTLLLLLYSTVNLDVASASSDQSAGAARLAGQQAGQLHNSTIGSTKSATVKVHTKLNTKHQLNTTPRTKEERFKVEISPQFTKLIPKNGAFWNRKLQAALRAAHSMDLHTPQTLESLKTNIADYNSYPPLYQDFLLSMHIRSPDLLINQPHKCNSEGKPVPVNLLFVIKSERGNFPQRQAVRETWGREKAYEDGRVRTVFLMGTQSSVDDPDLSQLISLEAEHFGDLLVWDFRDSFYNLTLKEHAFLKWSVKHCPQASFVFKGDDDVFVNTKAILKYLRSIDSARASKMYFGQVISKASPHRDRKIKYYVPPSFYDGPYPPYAGGGGFVFSGALLEALLNVTMRIPFYPIDDVYTAMCFLALGISPAQHSGFQTFDIREQDRENPCVHRGLLMVHRRSPQQAIRLWRSMESPMLTC